MRILVTGSYGQLGSELKELSDKYPGWEFLFTDADTLDITNEHAVDLYLNRNLPSLLINCAAFTAVDKAESETNAAHQINAIAPGILARMTKKHKAGFIHISTDYVFDGKGYKPYSEFDVVNPAGVYGKTKLAGERAIRSANVNAVIVRTAWLYSAYGNNFVKTMLRLGKERDVLRVVFDQVGSPTYAADLARALLVMAENYSKNPAQMVPGIYNYSNEGVASWFDFAKSIFEAAGMQCQVVPVLSEEYPTPAKRPHYSVLNKSKIKATFNMEIPYWKDSLKICINKLQKLENNG